MDYTSKEAQARQSRLNKTLDDFLVSLKRFREENNINAESVASDLGMTIDELTAFENPDLSCPTLYDLVYYANAVGADLDLRIYKYVSSDKTNIENYEEKHSNSGKSKFINHVITLTHSGSVAVQRICTDWNDPIKSVELLAESYQSSVAIQQDNMSVEHYSRYRKFEPVPLEKAR